MLLWVQVPPFSLETHKLPDTVGRRPSTGSKTKNGRGSGPKKTPSASSKPRSNATRRQSAPCKGGDAERAIDLLETSISEGFVGSHPYERLASICESRRNSAEALRVCKSFTQLAASGKMPRGAQRSADRKLPEFEDRIVRYRRSLDTDQ
jgi:hypothetical protein